MFTRNPHATALSWLVGAGLLAGMAFAMASSPTNPPPMVDKDEDEGQAAISDLKPNAGSPGSRVTIMGSHFTSITRVVFAPDHEASFNLISDTEIEATVPLGAVTGPIQVYTPSGVVHSKVPFMVEPQ